MESAPETPHALPDTEVSALAGLADNAAKADDVNGSQGRGHAVTHATADQYADNAYQMVRTGVPRIHRPAVRPHTSGF